MKFLIVFFLSFGALFSLELKPLKGEKIEGDFLLSDFFEEEASLPFLSLNFPNEPKILPDAPFPIYASVDERGMEFLVAVFSVKKLLRDFPFLSVSDVDTSRLIDSWLRKGKEAGTALKTYKRAVKDFPYEAFDLLFCTPEGLAIRARLIRTPDHFYALCTRVKDPLYTQDRLEKKTEEFNLYRRDYRRSKEFFGSLQLK